MQNNIVEKQDIVSEAESVVKSLRKNIDRRTNQEKFDLTSSQIRKFLFAVNSISNRLQGEYEEELSDKLADEIRFLKVKLVYAAGRTDAVKDFVQKSDLIKKIEAIGKSREKYDRLAKYVEAIVAYHKFYGGAD